MRPAAVSLTMPDPSTSIHIIRIETAALFHPIPFSFGVDENIGWDRWPYSLRLFAPRDT